MIEDRPGPAGSGAPGFADVGEVDILIGIPSFNNARTIGHVVRAVEAGLTKYFPARRSILVNSDGGSSDGTTDVVREAGADLDAILVDHRTGGFHKLVTPYNGIPGKGSAFRRVFELAGQLGAKACAVVDADLRSITPEWIELLVKPVLDGGYDYVAPSYLRHKYDGTITNTIVYPLTRALYGQRIRQPIGGDFGFSGKLASFYLGKDVWATDVARFGIDIWMTTTAVANGFKICQAFLGAKIHDAKDPGADLSAMLHQVVGSVFDLMDEYAAVWRSVKGSEPVATFGFAYAVGLEPINVNLERMAEMFRLGVRDLEPFYRSFLPAEVLDPLRELAAGTDGDRFAYPDETWVKTVLSFALACHRKVASREHIIKSLTPLYLGKVASFVVETWDATAEEVEGRLEALSLAFEKEKPYLVGRWDGMD
ncbi:MAG TPA: glycosyltransferase [Acidobacteriota bacterium]|nr:glycosyltransferase [Acidobacteriota bacterium]